VGFSRPPFASPHPVKTMTNIEEYIIKGITSYIRGYRDRNDHPGEKTRDEELADRFWRMWRVEYAEAGDEFLELWLHWKMCDEGRT